MISLARSLKVSFEGIQVAWNQVKFSDILQRPEELERLYCEIHLLKTLKHNNIMKFYTSWVDTAFHRYRLKQKQVNIISVKHWFRQILRGLLYFHSLDPAVIHIDLNCDNIFVNGNQGEVKIGDLGLAAILKKSHAAHCVRTSELMGPEVYEGECNELVGIYSFGMCILEIVTFDYPYSECTHPTQIYKKVISINDAQSELRPLDYCEREGIGPLIRKYAVKRKDVDIWGCKDRGKVKDGGADVLTVRSKLKLVVPTL